MTGESPPDQYPHPDERISRIVTATMDRFIECSKEEGVAPMEAIIALHQAVTGLGRAARVHEAALEAALATGGPVAVVVLTDDGDLAVVPVGDLGQANADA